MPVFGSYPLTPSSPFRTSSFLPPASIRIGVLHPPRGFSFLAVCHNGSPVFTSSATSDDGPSASQFWITMFPTMIGEAATPHGPGNSPSSFDQSTFPSKSKQCRPPGPKKANTCSPSVAQVGVA